MHFNNQWLIDDYEIEAFPAEQSSVAGDVGRAVLNGAFELTQIVAVAFLMYIGLNIIIPRYQVEGHSMEPSFSSEERVVVSTVHYYLGDPQRGDVVVFEHDRNLIKRVIGLPGEIVGLHNGSVYINGIKLEEAYTNNLCTTGSCRNTEWELGPDEYFVLGDNRRNSNDSHNFGPITRDQIIGRVVLRYWPLDDLRGFIDDVY